jgi:cation diffusion facilitator family transporter
MTNPLAEQRVLKLSVALTVAIAGFAVALGLLSGSMSIVFDGLFAVIDVAMGLLALWVARLVAREGNRTFQYGYWHIEPMSLAFYGGMLMVLCVYGFVSAVGSIIAGGQNVDLGWAIAYSLILAAVCLGMYLYEKRTNRAANSALLHLDAQSWLMTGMASAALVIAFAFAWWLKSTPYAHLAPYVDPAALALLSLVMVGMPIRTVRQAISEILMITPTDLDTKVRAVMDDVVARHAFTSYTSYSAKVGRGQFIEIHIVVPAEWPIGTVADLDAIRAEIGEGLGGPSPDQWLTIDFTAEERWT